MVAAKQANITASICIPLSEWFETIILRLLCNIHIHIDRSYLTDILDPKIEVLYKALFWGHIAIDLTEAWKMVGSFNFGTWNGHWLDLTSWTSVFYGFSCRVSKVGRLNGFSKLGSPWTMNQLSWQQSTVADGALGLDHAGSSPSHMAMDQTWIPIGLFILRNKPKKS